MSHTMNKLVKENTLAFANRKLRGVGRRINRLRWKALSVCLCLPSIPVTSVATVVPDDLTDPILDDICMPPFVGSTHDDLGVVLRVAKSLRPRLICEIGTAHGNLAANLLQNCPEASLITVNSPAQNQTGNLVTYSLSQDEIGRVYRRYGYENRVTQLLVNSLQLDLSLYARPNSIDLAIIDGCHDTKFVLNDFKKVHSFIRPGGVVLFHDTHPSQEGHLADSYRACLLLRARIFNVKWIDHTWWGWWQKVG